MIILLYQTMCGMDQPETSRITELYQYYYYVSRYYVGEDVHCYAAYLFYLVTTEVILPMWVCNTEKFHLTGS